MYVQYQQVDGVKITRGVRIWIEERCEVSKLVYFTGDIALVDNLSIENCMAIQGPLKKLAEYETSESGWIPCEIRCPELVNEQYDGSYISDPVWVTYKSIFDETPHTATEAAVYLGDEKWKWFDETDDLSNMEDVVCEIIAWRPLLEPYVPAGVIQACVNKACPHNTDGKCPVWNECGGNKNNE